MSSKKIYTTVGMDQEVIDRLTKEAEQERRSKSFIVEQILRNYYKLPWGEQGVKQHAD